MARKGKEPAGLRRYRLEQKRKKTKRSRGRTSKPRKAKSMARRRSYGRRRRRSAGSKKIPLLTTGAVVAMAYKVGMDTYQSADKPDTLMRYVTGYSPAQNNFDWQPLMITYGLPIAGALGSKLASKFGINRAIAAIPFVKL